MSDPDALDRNHARLPPSREPSPVKSVGSALCQSSRPRQAACCHSMLSLGRWALSVCHRSWDRCPDISVTLGREPDVHQRAVVIEPPWGRRGVVATPGPVPSPLHVAPGTDTTMRAFSVAARGAAQSSDAGSARPGRPLTPRPDATPAQPRWLQPGQSLTLTQHQVG